MTKIGTFYLLFSFVVLLLFFDQPFNLFLLILFANILYPSLFFVYLKSLQRQFQREFVRFSGVVLLKMKMGEGFRSAYASTLGQGSWKFTLVLQELLNNVVFSQQNQALDDPKIDQFLVYCLKVLRRVDGNPGSALLQLTEFRRHLILLHKFRRRSGQIWGQILTQALVVAAFYLLLLTYMLVNYGFNRNIYIVIFSGCLFILGIGWLFRLREVKPCRL